MLTPKLYQLQTIETLAEFLRRTRELGGPAAAFTQITSERTGVGLPYYNAPGFAPADAAGMPYGCLRLPTGEAAPNRKFEILREDGAIIRGVSDANGRTGLQKSQFIGRFTISIIE